ncbi:hypothetical protein EWH23_08430 [Meiothermus sp. PNK-Is4]|nr:hypothetical protein EWH23_08430 [Meiothermus sp. PNK-Is4]
MEHKAHCECACLIVGASGFTGVVRGTQYAKRQTLNAGDDPLLGRATPVHPRDDPLSGPAGPVHPGVDSLRDGLSPYSRGTIPYPAYRRRRKRFGTGYARTPEGPIPFVRHTACDVGRTTSRGGWGWYTSHAKKAPDSGALSCAPTEL